MRGLDRVVRMRLATQRLTARPFTSVDEAVRSLVAVQAQDAPLSRWSLGMRVRKADDAVVREALDSGRVLRLHALRPTWHYVAAGDLEWILRLTSPKVESAMAARHRQLTLDDQRVLDAVLARVEALLAGGTYLTRRQLAEELGPSEWAGERLGHVLLLAELRGLVCSGPMEGSQHRYALVAERVPPTPGRDRDDAGRELVRRFFAGHGPASVAHLVRWTTLTGAEVTAALADLRDRLTSVEVDGQALWYDPATQVRTTRSEHAFLLPVFDEAFLTYPGSNVVRAPHHPSADEPHRFAEAGGGIVLCDRRDVGWWRRTVKGRTMDITVALAAGLGSRERTLVEEAGAALGAFAGCEPRVRFVD